MRAGAQRDECVRPLEKESGLGLRERKKQATAERLYRSVSAFSETASVSRQLYELLLEIVHRGQQRGELRADAAAPAESIWTVEPAFGGQAYFTITAEMTVPFVPGIFLYPILRRMFYPLNFPPFIRAAQRSGKRETLQAS